MIDLLLDVEIFLTGEGVSYFRDEDGDLRFNCACGNSDFDCIVHQAGQILVLDALWIGEVPTDQLEVAEDVLRRLSNVYTSWGSTYFNRRRGQLAFTTSIDLSMVTLRCERVGGILENLLDPFSKKIGAMHAVLNGTTAADAAVDSYAMWVKEKIAKMMRPFLEGDADPSLN
jgi:hypothetical protein